MKIHFDEIPQEGLELTDKIDPDKLSMGLESQGIVFTGFIDVSANVRKTGENILVDVVLNVGVEYTCSLCLAKVPDIFKKKFDLIYEAGPGDIVDVDNDIRQEIILDYPIKVVCRPDCKGLCPNCGQNLNINKCEC